MKRAAALALLLPSLGLACSVAIDYPPELSNASHEEQQQFYWKREFERADAVIEVRVRSVKRHMQMEPPRSTTRVEVLRSWKADGKDLQLIESSLGGGDCGVGFAAGQRYLVFANRNTNGRLDTWAYGTIRVGKDFDAVIALLDSLAKK
jgi:hypothetical protein